MLKSDESNYYAAMGIAITFAESAHLSTAWKIFSLLLEDCEFDDIFMVNSAKLAILMRKFDTAMAVLTNYLENSATTYEDNCETLLGLAYLKNKYYEEAKRTYQRLILKFPGDQNHRLNLLTIYQEEAANVIRQEHRHVYEVENALKYLKITQRFLKHMQTYTCKPQNEQQQQTIEIENLDSESDSSRAQESNLTKFAKLVENKVKWVAAKLPLLEKIFVQEQETLKLRQLIRNERHAKRDNAGNVEEKNSEYIMEQKARQMLEDAAKIAEEMDLHSRRKKNLRLGGKLKGLKPPKKEQDPDKPKEVKPKKLPKKFHLRYFLMDGETTKQRNKKKKKSDSDDEDEDDFDGMPHESEEEEDVEAENGNEDEDDFPQGFMGFDEPEESEEEEDEDKVVRLDEKYVENMIKKENKSNNKSSAKRSAEPKKLGNRGLNSMIKKFIYTDTKAEPKTKKKRKLNNGNEKENQNNSEEELVVYEDDEEEDDEEEADDDDDGDQGVNENESEKAGNEMEEEIEEEGEEVAQNQDEVFISE